MGVSATLTTTNEAVHTPGAGQDIVIGANSPDDQIRYWVKGEAQPRIIIDPTNHQVLTGNGTAAPGPLTGIAAFIFSGVYAAGTTYATNALVTGPDGGSYASRIDGNIGHTPASSPTQWQQIAAPGAAGSNGSNGATGAAGPSGSAGTPGPTYLPFGQTGAVTVATGTRRLAMVNAGSFKSVVATVDTASASGSIVIDVKKNGTTIFSSGGTGAPVIITAGSHISSIISTFATGTFASGDYITVDVTVAGTSAQNLTVSVVVSGGADVTTVKQITPAHTLDATDANCILEIIAAGVITLPPNSAVPFAYTDEVIIRPLVTGVSVATGVGVTLDVPTGFTAMSQYGSYAFNKTAGVSGSDINHWIGS